MQQELLLIINSKKTMFSLGNYIYKTLGWKKVLFAFLVTIFLVGCGYLASAYQKNSKKNIVVITNNQENIAESVPGNIDKSIPIIDDTPVFSPTEIPTPVIDIPIVQNRERSKDPEIRLQEAKDFTEPKIVTGKYIDISLKYQNMVIFEEGKAVESYLISSGKKGFDTPVGEYKIENKSPRAWSKAYNLWMPNWMAFVPSGKMGIHELPIWPNGYQEGASHLGTPVSHGCVRLGKGSAKIVYDWAEIGTPVIIHL
jgi:lipoprotein-anchoring transpeptidase ErfK/SrfK